MTTLAPDIAPDAAPAASGPAVAHATLQIAAQVADLCARPPRLPGGTEDITCAFFLISAPSVAWVEAAAAHPRIRAVGVATEAMASFAAIEASIATGRLQIVVCGAGPGTLGHLEAIPAARAQGAQVLMLVPRTPAHLAGGIDVQEASWDQPLHRVGADLFDAVIAIEDVAEMPRVATRLRHLFARPQGAVAQLCVPANLLARPCPDWPDLSRIIIELPAPSATAITNVAVLLRGSAGPPAFLFGSGAVAYRERLGPLVDRWDAVFFTTPAATAMLPGSLGVVGNAAHGDVAARLRKLGVRVVVVLGSRLGTASGGNDAGLLPDDCHVVHVDVAPDPLAGNAVATRGRSVTFIPADIGEFLDALEPVEDEPSTVQGATI